MNLSDTLAIAGALALVAMLDVVVRPRPKKRVSDWLIRLSNTPRPARYRGSAFLDRFFGQPIFSWRAIPRYAAISLASITLSYILAVLTSPAWMIKEMWLWSGRPTAFDFAILLSCFAAAVIGDIFSYAQTRLFVRTIDKSRSGVVAVGLATADLIISLSIFFFAFSFARLVCVLIVLSVPPEQTLRHTDTYATAFLKAALSQSQFELSGDKQPLTAYAVAIANADDASGLSRAAELTRATAEANLSTKGALKQVRFSAKRRCATRDEVVRANEALSGSKNLYLAVAAEQAKVKALTVNPAEIARKVQASHIASFLEIEDRKACAQQITEISGTLTAANFISSAGPIEAWLAAFERTLFDAYQVLGMKLAPYIFFDPYATAPEYAESLKRNSTVSLLGAFPVDADRVALISFFQAPVEAVEGEVRVPFSPMVASALTTSIFLSVYVALIGLAVVRSRLTNLIAKYLPALDIEKSVFTTIAIALAVTFMTISAGLWILALLWRLMLGG